MGLSDELERLGALHGRGVLTDDEFARAKARVLRGEAGVAAPPLQAINGLRRSRDDRWLGGVCGGLGRATSLGSWVWRLMFVLLVLCAGTGALVYLLMWLLVPADPPYFDGAQGQPRAG